MQGFGMLLMEEAERIAQEEHGSHKISVISGKHCIPHVSDVVDRPSYCDLLYSKCMNFVMFDRIAHSVCMTPHASLQCLQQQRVRM